VARQGVTDGSGELRFDNLPLGPYTLVEEDRPGWSEVTARELDIDVVGNMCADEDLVVEFINEQDDSGFCIEGRKVDANGGYGIMGWEITIEELDEGGALPLADIDDPSSDEIDSTLTDGVGEFRFDFARSDYRIPGAKYEVCEQEQDGWLAHTPTCQIVRLSEWPGACVQLEDFVNQQVGHSESEKHDDRDKGDEHGKGEDHGNGDEYGKGEDRSNGEDRGNGEDYGNGEDHGNGEDRGKGGPDGGNNQGGHEDGPSYDGDDNAQCSSYHVVKAGEGLYDIGNEYHKTPQEMLDANPSVRDGDQLWVYEGQRICIP
jgi:hypothetical protein